MIPSECISTKYAYSKECQIQHWKEHKAECRFIKKQYDEWKSSSKDKDLTNGSALDTKEGPCAICLEETITNPVILPCGLSSATHDVSEIISGRLKLCT